MELFVLEEVGVVIFGSGCLGQVSFLCSYVCLRIFVCVFVGFDCYVGYLFFGSVVGFLVDFLVVCEYGGKGKFIDVLFQCIMGGMGKEVCFFVWLNCSLDFCVDYQGYVVFGLQSFGCVGYCDFFVCVSSFQLSLWFVCEFFVRSCSHGSKVVLVREGLIGEVVDKFVFNCVGGYVGRFQSRVDGGGYVFFECWIGSYFKVWVFFLNEVRVFFIQEWSVGAIDNEQGVTGFY